MALELPVYAFNDGYPLYLFINGIKHYFGSSDWSGLVFMVVSLLTLIGLLSFKQISPAGYLRAYAGPLLLYALFFSQTATIHIEDEWAEEGFSVDDIPVAVAIPLYLATSLEKSMVELVEQHMMPPNATSFKEFDFFMEAGALSEVVNGKALGNFELMAFIDRYFEDCVLKGIATGFVNPSVYYRSGDLLTDTYMPWGVYFTEVIMPDGRSMALTCKDAYTQLFNRTDNAATSVAPDSILAHLKASMSTMERKQVMDAAAAMGSLANNLFPGYQSTSETLFKQAYMMNGVHSSLARSNPAMLAAIAQAEVAQSTGIAAASAVYIKKLPKLRAMTKMIIIGMAPFAAAMFLAQMGRPLMIWFAALLSVSFWLPIMCIIKATYVTSAINELQGMIIPSNGMTIPNKLKIMAWISDTSTVAGTLAMAIPAFASLMMQFIAPKLALALGALSMGVGGMASTAQRAGMNALPQAEKTAMELERDKMNRMMLEAGDVEQQRRGQMNTLADARHNKNYGRVSGESPMQHGATATDVGKGYTMKGASSGSEDATLSAQESAARASVSQSAASTAYSGLTQASTADQQRIAQSISDSHIQTGNVQATKAESATMQAAEEVGKSRGVDATQIANAQSALKLGLSAGLDSSKLGAFVAKAMGSGEGSVSTQDSKKHSDVASEMVKHALSNQDVQSYQESQSAALTKAQSTSNENGHSTGTSTSENWQTGIQRMNSETASYQNIKSRNDSMRAQLSAGGEITADTARMTKYAPVGVLRNLALEAGSGMANTAKYIRGGGYDENQIRRYANDDLAIMLRTADTAGGAARDQALSQAKNVMGDLSTVGQLETSQEASRALSILNQREGYVSAVQPAFVEGGAWATQVSQPGGPMQVPDAKTSVLDGAPAAPKISNGPAIPVVTADSPNVYNGEQALAQGQSRKQHELGAEGLKSFGGVTNDKWNAVNKMEVESKNVLDAEKNTRANTWEVVKENVRSGFTK